METCGRAGGEGRVRRAKLYYLRAHVGKSARVKERLRAANKPNAKRRAAAAKAAVEEATE